MVQQVKKPKTQSGVRTESKAASVGKINFYLKFIEESWCFALKLKTDHNQSCLLSFINYNMFAKFIDNLVSQQLAVSRFRNHQHRNRKSNFEWKNQEDMQLNIKAYEFMIKINK